MDNVRVVRVPLRLANSYLVIGTKTIIVDTGDPGFSGGILKALKRNGIKQSDVSLIFLTHGHIDHYGSVFALKRYINAPIAMHKIDEKYMVQGIQAPLYPSDKASSLIKAIGKDMKVRRRYDCQVDIVFDDNLDLSEFGVNGTLQATPGHTLGSASLVLENCAAITGDLVLKKYFFTGTAIPCPFMHDRDKFTTSIQTLLNMGVRTLYPGHGGPISSDEIIRFARKAPA